MQERTKNSYKNIVMGLANNFVVLLLSFISRKLFIRYLGVELLGINGLFVNILSILSLADLGFGTAMSFSFYKPLSERDEEKLAALITYYKTVYNIIAAGVASLGILLLPFLKYLVNVEQDIPFLWLYYLIFLTNTVISYLFVYKSSILNAAQKNHLVSTWSIIVNIAKIVMQVIVLILFKNYFVYLFITILSSLGNNLVVSIVAEREFPAIKRKETLGQGDKKEILSSLKAVFLYKISGTLLNSIDSILISVLISTAMVGYYTNYQTIVLNLTQIITIVFTSVTASIGNVIITESQETRHRVFKTMQMISFFLSSLIAICVYCCSEEFIVLWLGQEYVLGKWVVLAITFNLFFSTSMQPLWSFREATGLYKKTKYVMLVAAGLNLIFSVVLGYYLGLAGIILATVMAKASTYFWYEPHILFKEYFGKSEKGYYLEYGFNLMLLTVGIVASIYLTRLLPHAETFVLWVCKALLCCLVACLLYVIAYGRTEQFRYVVGKAQDIFKRKKEN